MARNRSQRSGRRQVLPVVIWLHAGAAVAAAGIALSAAPTAAADDGDSSARSGSPSSQRSTATRGGAQQGSTPVSRRAAAPAHAGANPARPAAARAVRAATPVVSPVRDETPKIPATVPAPAPTPVRPAATAKAPNTAAASPPQSPVSAGPTTAAADPSIRLAVLGDAGNSYTNGTNFYYSPGFYKRYSIGASGPLQQAVAEMMRSWNPTDVVQLGDESYNVASSTLLDYNIGQYYNNWIHPYAPPAYTQPGSIYADGTLGGVQAEPGKTQWPYNLYNFPNGFPNPVDPGKPGGSPDGVNHYFAVPGNHDEAEIVGTYNDASVDQVNFARDYIGAPIGPDAYDYQNNIKNPPTESPVPSKTGSTQSLLDYHAYLGDGNPGNLKPGTLTIGKLDPNGYGIYYGVNLGDAGDGRPLIHLTIIDTTRLLTDAGSYDFNFAPNAQNPARDPSGKQVIKRTQNFNYDVRQPLTASDAWFQDPSVPLDAPSIGREMFLWAKDDLANSDAVWNIVMGHHPAYHVGNPANKADETYTSNAVVLNFLEGLTDDTGAPLFDAYMNGHSHAYARVLEMTPSADGIGTGIPFFTIGDGGKVLDALNLAEYGTGVLEPVNYGNVINGDQLTNRDINGYLNPTDPGNSEAESLAPYQSANPTSVGVSGFYTYSRYNWPEGDGYIPGVDPSKLTITSVSDPTRTFDLKQPAYLSYLSDQADLSGLYGYGSGAAQLDAGDSYMFVHYQTAQPVDPAIALIGRSQGVTSFDPNSLFYNQWSPGTAKAEDLAMFSFDIDDTGSLQNVQLVNRGNGYFESDPTAGSYLDTTQDFEILGNNPANPLGFNSSDPTRAVVRLSFSGGQLKDATLVNPGSGYEQVANAILQCNDCGSNTLNNPKRPGNNSLLVGINIDLEAQYNLAATRPTGSDPYHDWYMMTDTAVGTGSTRAAGAFGAVDLSLQPRSQVARQLIADTPLTTGYAGTGPQQKYLAPQTGDLTLVDSLGQQVGTATVAEGTAKVTLNQLAAPGPLRVTFAGDSTSSYQVNFRGINLADNVQLGLRYGTWNGPVAQQGSQLTLSDTQTMQVTRTDSGPGLVSFGLSNGNTSKLLALWAKGAETGSIQAGDLFVDDPSLNWQSTEHRSEGGTGSARLRAGSWTPTARLNGRDLQLVDLQLTSNGAVARFAAGNPDDPSDDVLATFTLPGNGTTTGDQNGVLTVRRLSGHTNGVALYEADPVTGAVVDGRGRTRLPGQIGYLKAALDNAKSLGLVVNSDDMPDFGQTAEFTDLPLDLNRNYGTLLLVNGSEHNLLSSFAAANNWRANQALTLVAPDRGVSVGFEDKRPLQLGNDRDFNDVIVTLTTAAPTVTG